MPGSIPHDDSRPLDDDESDDLAPPGDIDKLLQSKRSTWAALKHAELPRRWQIGLTCLSIGLSAGQANGVYCWPTYGPVIAKQLELSGSQSQTIVVGGILGVYLMAAPLGSLTDRYGPRVASLASGVLAALGYLSFAALLSALEPGTPFIHLYLTAAFFCVGAATVGSYFSCLTCASLSFPSYPTLSLSVPLSLLGLSSLLLSSFSSIPAFQTPASELDARKFLIFLGILSPAINAFASMFMRVIPPPPQLEDAFAEQMAPEIMSPLTQSIYDERLSQSLHLTERTPLLIGGIEAAREVVEVGKEVKWTAWGLIKDWDGFWVFGILIAFCIGPSETIIASIGSILTSLLPPDTRLTDLQSAIASTASTFESSPFISLATFATAAAPSALSLRNKHVYILSAAGTISRLITGFVADRLSPPLKAIPNPAYDPDDSDNDEDNEVLPHLFVREKPILLSRSMYASICALILAAIFAWSAGVLQTEKGLWVLSAGTGALYGALFTLFPAIVSSHFGPTNFGLAWGMVSYFAALGSVLFSYVFALLFEVVASEETDVTSSHSAAAPAAQCYGPKCFQATLWIAAGCCVVSSAGIVFIGKRWNV